MKLSDMWRQCGKQCSSCLTRFRFNTDRTTTKIHQVIKSALALVDQSIDFSQFNSMGNDQWIDAITIVHSGYAAEHDTSQRNRIWSHKWKFRDGPWTSAEGVQVLDYNINPALWGTVGNQIGRIGVICHELGHYLGIYDLYDTQAYAGSVVNGYGIGLHGLMANSWGFDYSQLYPAHLSPWTMLQLGFASPATPIAGVNTVLRMDISPIGDQKSVFKIGDGTLGFPVGEYLLVCYAKFMKYNVSPFQGILIYHIDETVGYNEEGYPGQTGWPNNGKHYRIALMQPDGLYDLEKGKDFGDSGDFFKQDWSITPYGVYYKGSRVNSFPNTHTYQAGVIQNTGLTIQVVSAPEGDTMQFLISGRDDLPSTAPPTAQTALPTQLPAVSPTPNPTPPLTMSPTPYPTPLPTVTPTFFPIPSPTFSPTPVPTTIQIPTPTNPPTTPNPSSSILILVSEDFEDEMFELATASQLNSMSSIVQERSFDGGKLGTLVQPNSLIACGASCNLAKNPKMCIGNKCVKMAGTTNRNAALMIGVDTMGRYNIEIDFQVYTRSPVTNGQNVCVEYTVNNGINWTRLQCFNGGNIVSQKWTSLNATLTVPDNNPIVQVRVRSMQRKNALFVDSITILGMSQ
jgi:M6 family metalloprotease-like protein